MTDERPALTVVETQTLHDGEPMHWWQWSEAGGHPDPDEGPGSDRRGSARTITALNFLFSDAAETTNGGGGPEPCPPESVVRGDISSTTNSNITALPAVTPETPND